MKCPICGKEVILENKQVGVAENGDPILNQYAICRDCKKQWNLDRQRAKKAAAKARASAKPQTESASAAKAPAKKPQAEKVPADKAPAGRAAAQKPQTDKAPEEKKNEPVTRPIPQKKIHDAALAAETETTKNTEQNSSNSPSKKTPAKRPVRRADSDSADKPAKRSRAGSEGKRARKTSTGSDAGRVHKAEADSEAKRVHKTEADSDAKRVHKAEADSDVKRVRKTDADSKGKPARKAPANSAETGPARKKADSQTYGNIPSEKVRAKRELAVKKGYEEMLASDPKSAAAKKRAEAAKKAAKSVREDTRKKRHDEDYEEESFDDLPSFRIPRVILGILSLVAGAYLGYTGFQTNALPYYALAACALISGLLLLILQMSNTLFTYLIPMMLYTAGGVFAFLERDDDPVLLYASIVYVVLGVIFLILAFSSRKDEEYEDYDEDEDDDWED